MLAILLLSCGWASAAADSTQQVRTLLGESFAAMQAAKSFRATAVSEQGDTKITVENDTVWPDRFHVRSGGREFIFVPGSSWLKQDGGAWTQLPVDMSEMVKSLSPDAMAQALANLENAKLIGTEAMGSRSAIVLEYDTHATVMGIETKSHVKVWLDSVSKLPIQQQAAGTAQGVQSNTFTRYDFVSDLKIEAPK